MKMIIALALLVAVAAARPQETVRKAPIPILFESYVMDEAGQYSLTYVSGDGTERKERGYFVPIPLKKGYAWVKDGSVSYTNPEGRRITETFTSGLDGHKVMGDHLPKEVVA